jgi:hypothetical protein
VVVVVLEMHMLGEVQAVRELLSSNGHK